MKQLLEFLMRIFFSISARVAVAAIIISVVIISVVLIIFGFTYTNSHGIVSSGAQLTTSEQIVISSIFLLIFFVIWFLLYVQTTREADDLYSRARKRLIGKWNVNYTPSNGHRAGPLYPDMLAILCEIHINPSDKKLEFEFKIENNPIYESGKQIINSVAIRHDVGNRYDVFYYYGGKRKLQDGVKIFLKEDEDFSRHDGLEIEIFGILHFELPNRGVVSVLKGEWFDLNGKVTQLFSLLDMARQNQFASISMEPVKLSEVKINIDNFASKMGDISFERIA